MTKKKEIFLIIICWFSYLVAQIGRYSYSSNITLIMDKFSIVHTVAGIPSTLFFFAYGVGQILVGIFCNKFNRRLLVISALSVSGVINLVIFFGAEFFTIKYLWFLNGFVQANLWPVLLLILRENISSDKLSIACVAMSTASTGGKFAAIGLCAIFAINTRVFMYCFLTAGLMLVGTAVIFFFATLGIKSQAHTEKNDLAQKLPKQKNSKKDIVLLLLLGEFSLVCYAVSGGLQSWVPAILKESYGLSDAMSIFMSILLPLFALTIAFISPYVNRKLKNNYVLVSLIAFLLGAVWIISVLFLLAVHWLPVIILFTVETITMGLVSNTTTVEVPLTFKGKFNAGFLAGYLNGACYLGMALSTYVLGYIADASGWTIAFILLITIVVFSALLAVIYLIFSRKVKLNDKGK